MSSKNFSDNFEKITGYKPFPWQVQLYLQMIKKSSDNIPDILSIPTGLGKTSIIAIWLLARMENQSNIPKRLVYIVNRRTVVDQATTEAEKILNKMLEIGLFEEDQQPTISTLRGQYVDHGEWRENPSRPAIICGTIDMIGSRLLFNGYRSGFKSQPLHAGFLGQDSLLVHDESHLEPAFQKLIEDIEKEQEIEKQKNNLLLLKLRIMEMSATSRNVAGNKTILGLTDEEKNPPENIPLSLDEPIHYVWKRIKSPKTLLLEEEEKNKVHEKIANIAKQHKESNENIIIYVNSLSEVDKIYKDLIKKGSGIKKEQIRQLTGTIRGYERDRLVEDPVFIRFLPENDRPDNVEPVTGTVYLICTSAGEVGVNLSADHMVCDLVPLDRMLQRFGRVNRFGKKQDTKINIVHSKEIANYKEEEAEDGDKKSKKIPSKYEKSCLKTFDLLKSLKEDASPMSLEKMLSLLQDQEREDAFSPKPVILESSDILFDKWALTTIRDDMPGRPPIYPYLHGIEDFAAPRTSVVWRKEVEIIDQEILEHNGNNFIQDIMNDYPIKPHEVLNNKTETVFKFLVSIANNLPDLQFWIQDPDTKKIEILNIKEIKNIYKTNLVEKIIILPSNAGGLSNGFLNNKSEESNDVSDEWYMDGEQRRARFLGEHEPPKDMVLVRTIDTQPNITEDYETDENEEEHDYDEELSVKSKSKRYWYWYARTRDAENATSSSTSPISLEDHTNDVVDCAKKILKDLSLPNERSNCFCC